MEEFRVAVLIEVDDAAAVALTRELQQIPLGNLHRPARCLR